MSKTKAVQSPNWQAHRITVILTKAKMEAAGIHAEEGVDGDIYFELPQMSEEQEQQLAGVWGRFRDDLADVGIDSRVIDASVSVAIDALRKETNARIIADLL